MSVLEEREPTPACEDDIQSHTEIDWRWATEFDLDTFEPCTYCFPDADGVEDIDYPAGELIVTGTDGRKLHRHEDTGPIRYDAAVNSRTDKDLNNLLRDPDFGPQEFDERVKGGDA